MLSSQIEKILYSMPQTRNLFLGCFAANQIPYQQILDRLHSRFHQNKHQSSLIIINTDSSWANGTHWVAAFVTSAGSGYDGKEKKIYYFDSYALDPPPSSQIVEFLAKFKQCIQNKKRYQSPFSDVCGQYCITFCYFMAFGYSYAQFLTILNHQNNADYFVQQFIKKIIA